MRKKNEQDAVVRWYTIEVGKPGIWYAGENGNKVEVDRNNLPEDLQERIRQGQQVIFDYVLSCLSPEVRESLLYYARSDSVDPEQKKQAMDILKDLYMQCVDSMRSKPKEAAPKKVSRKRRDEKANG